MATNVLRANFSGLLNIFRHELFKGIKQAFNKMVIAGPLVIVMAIILIQALVKLLANPDPGPLTTPLNPFSPYDLGNNSTFTLASSIVFLNIYWIYSFMLAISCALVVANEYRWNTIKMLATREPSRANIALSKCLFALTLVAGSYLAFAAGWLIYGLFLKWFYNVPFSLDSNDLDAIGKGLFYLAINSLMTFILALFALALTFRFKSLAAGIIGFLVYRGVDAAINAIGVGVNNNGYEGVADWVKPFLDIAVAINPFLLTSSANRIAMYEKVPVPPGVQVPLETQGLLVNKQIIVTNPVWGAWLVLAAYLILFTLLAIAVFSRRDITD